MPSDQLLTKNIGEEFICVGQWWLPTGPDPRNPECKCGGTLTFVRGDGIKLEVMGQLQKEEFSEKLVGRTVEMIWGLSTEGELITLLNCQSAGMTIGAVWTESYVVGQVFASKRAWFAPSEHITFTSLGIQYTHLADWVGVSGFRSPKPDEYDEFIIEKKAEIFFKRPSDTPPIFVKNNTVSIRFGNSWPSIRPAMQEAHIKQYTWIFVEPRNSKEITLDEALIFVRGIQNFLTLVMYDNAVYPTVIEGRVKTEEKMSEEKSQATMRLLYEPVGTKPPRESILRHNILFAYEEVADFWQRALNNLIQLDGDQLKPVLNNFFAEYFSPSAYAEDRLMATIRTIEAFHRRTTEKACYMSKEKYNETLLKKFTEEIDELGRLGEIDADFQQSLKKRLSCGYSYLLEKRLNDLFTSYGKSFLTRFLPDEQTDFIRKIVATRNWFTHYDEEEKGEALESGPELVFLNLKLQLFVVVLLLNYAGFPPEKIQDKLKHHQFDYLRVKPS
ncbi:MAG: HEPN domain-containing protein [Halobacteriota archaeon]